MLLDHFAYKGQAQAGGFFMLIVAFSLDAIKFLPDSIDGFRWNAITAVFDTDAYCLSLQRGRNGYSGPFRTIRDGVVHQILNDLSDKASIGSDRRDAIGWLFDQTYALFPGRGL